MQKTYHKEAELREGNEVQDALIGSDIHSPIAKSPHHDWMPRGGFF